jgi:hypothetical protein
MIRGKKIYTLFGPEETPVASAEDQRGRDPELIRLRNEHLLYRFAWYRADIRNSYEWMVQQLSREFYLSESTIGQLIEASSEVLARIRGEKPTERDLKRKFPFFEW